MISRKVFISLKIHWSLQCQESVYLSGHLATWPDSRSINHIIYHSQYLKAALVEIQPSKVFMAEVWHFTQDTSLYSVSGCHLCSETDRLWQNRITERDGTFWLGKVSNVNNPPTTQLKYFTSSLEKSWSACLLCLWKAPNFAIFTKNCILLNDSLEIEKAGANNYPMSLNFLAEGFYSAWQELNSFSTVFITFKFY